MKVDWPRALASISVNNGDLTDQNRPPDDPLAATGTIETHSLLTLLTPFLVFGALFVVLLLVWDR